MARKKKNNNIEETMLEIGKMFEKLDVTDYDNQDFSTPPENWHPEKIMFLIHKSIKELKLKTNPPTASTKHMAIVSCLRSIGFTSIKLTHSFSPTYLGYIQEYFSWRFEMSKSTEIDKKDDEVKSRIQGLALKDPIPLFMIENFEEIPLRTIGIYYQTENIVRLFKELYLGLKKASKPEGSNINLEKNIVDVILIIIPFVLADFEALSISRKNSKNQSEQIKGLDGLESGITTTLKVNALFKKPTIRVSITPKTELFKANIKEIEAN